MHRLAGILCLLLTCSQARSSDGSGSFSDILKRGAEVQTSEEKAKEAKKIEVIKVIKVQKDNKAEEKEATLMSRMKDKAEAQAKRLELQTKIIRVAAAYLEKNITLDDLQKRTKKLEGDIILNDPSDLSSESKFMDRTELWFHGQGDILKTADDTSPENKEIFIQASFYIVFAVLKDYDFSSRITKALNNPNLADKIDSFNKKSVISPAEKK